jgi:hypothetical protein
MGRNHEKELLAFLDCWYGKARTPPMSFWREAVADAKALVAEVVKLRAASGQPQPQHLDMGGHRFPVRSGNEPDEAACCLYCGVSYAGTGPTMADPCPEADSARAKALRSLEPYLPPPDTGLCTTCPISEGCVRRWRDVKSCLALDLHLSKTALAAARTRSAEVERLAALAHELWAGWARRMLDWLNSDPEHVAYYNARWLRQIATPYEQLPEREKGSARKDAYKMSTALKQLAQKHHEVEWLRHMADVENVAGGFPPVAAVAVNQRVVDQARKWLEDTAPLVNLSNPVFDATEAALAEARQHVSALVLVYQNERRKLQEARANAREVLLRAEAARLPEDEPPESDKELP